MHGGFAYLQRVIHVHAVVGDGGADRVPALRFDVLSGAGAAIVFRSHLRQQSVAQSQRRIAEAGQLAAFQKFGVDHRARRQRFPRAAARRRTASCAAPGAGAPASWRCAASAPARPRSRADLSSCRGHDRPPPGKRPCPRWRSPPWDGICAMRSAIRPISRSTNPRRRRSSALRGGSCCRNSLVSRTAPRGRLTVSRMWPLAGNRQLATSAAQINHQSV